MRVQAAICETSGEAANAARNWSDPGSASAAKSKRARDEWQEGPRPPERHDQQSPSKAHSALRGANPMRG